MNWPLIIGIVIVLAGGLFVTYVLPKWRKK